MDFQTISIKIERNQYRDEAHLCGDIDLIFSNCFTFNHSESVYYKSGVEFQKIIQPEVEAFRHAVINTQTTK